MINLQYPDGCPWTSVRDSGDACLTRPIMTLATLSQSSEAIEREDIDAEAINNKTIISIVKSYKRSIYNNEYSV